MPFNRTAEIVASTSEEPQATKAPDLMAALEESIAAVKGKREGKQTKKPAKKRAAKKKKAPAKKRSASTAKSSPKSRSR